MADTNTNTITVTDIGATTLGGATNIVTSQITPAPAVTTNNTEHMIPKHRFDEVYGQMKTLQEQLKAIEDAKAETAKKELEDTNQFKALYEQQKAEYEALQAKAGAFETSATAYETVINGLVETKLAGVPTELHDLIPANLTASEKLDWINKAESKGLFGVKQQTSVPIGQPVGVANNTLDVTKLSATELLTLAYTKK